MIEKSSHYQRVKIKKMNPKLKIMFITFIKFFSDINFIFIEQLNKFLKKKKNPDLKINWISMTFRRVMLNFHGRIHVETPCHLMSYLLTKNFWQKMWNDCSNSIFSRLNTYITALTVTWPCFFFGEQAQIMQSNKKLKLPKSIFKTLTFKTGELNRVTLSAISGC